MGRDPLQTASGREPGEVVVNILRKVENMSGEEHPSSEQTQIERAVSGEVQPECMTTARRRGRGSKRAEFELCEGRRFLRRKRGRWSHELFDCEELLLIGRVTDTGEPFLLTEGGGSSNPTWYCVKEQLPQRLRTAIRRSFEKRLATDLFTMLDLRGSDMQMGARSVRTYVARKFFDEVWVPKYLGGWTQQYVVLNVPKEDKEAVKARGGRFDWVIERWYVPSSEDLSAFKNWLLPII
jgi:hypothetical protein